MQLSKNENLQPDIHTVFPKLNRSWLFKRTAVTSALTYLELTKPKPLVGIFLDVQQLNYTHEHIGGAVGQHKLDQWVFVENVDVESVETHAATCQFCLWVRFQVRAAVEQL